MSCHESLMARRRKKSRAAANAKAKKEEQSTMLVDKSLPALPPNAILQSAFSPDRETPDSLDNDTPTELSPRPRQAIPDSASRSSSRRPRSPERVSSDQPAQDNLTLPTTTYRNNRHSAISQFSDIQGGGDGESFFIPLALDPSPATGGTPRTNSDAWQDLRNNKENKPEKDYFAINKNSSRPEPRSRDVSSSSTPHIAFQEKGRQASTDETRIKESIQRAQSGSKSLTRPSALNEKEERQTPQVNPPANPPRSSSEKFRLGEVPKNRRVGTSRTNSEQDLSESGATKRSIGMTRKEVPRTDSPKQSLAAEKAGTPRSSQDSRVDDSRPSLESSHSSAPLSRTIARKDVGTSSVRNNIVSASSSDGAETSPSTTSSSDGSGITPTFNKTKTMQTPTSSLSPKAEEIAPPSRNLNRPAPPQQKLSDSYMAPRAPPPPPPAVPQPAKEQGPNGAQVSPKLPRWSAGGDFTMDEEMARIIGGTDESSQSILRRVSNAVRHGRTNSETSSSARLANHNRSISETTQRTMQSPRWPSVSIAEDPSMPAKDISSPISVVSPVSIDDPALLRRQLRNSEQRVAELERQFVSEKDLDSLNKKLIEKRKTVSVLDSQTEIMIRQLEVLAGYVEKAKDSKQPLNIAELEDSAIKDFVQKLEKLKQQMAGAVETLYEERNELLEEKNQIMIDRDRALVEFEQLSSKNAQLADMNNDLTHQIQERFKSQSAAGIESPRPPMNGLGIYTHHNKDKSNASIMLEDGSLRPSTGATTLYGSSNGFDDGMEPPTMLAAPHVVNIRKGQAKKFNWKKGGQTVAKGVSKGFKGAFGSNQQDRNQWQGQPGENIGMPYNMTVAPVDSPAGQQGQQRAQSNDPAKSKSGFGLFSSNKGNQLPKSVSTMSLPTVENPSVLFGSDLIERADYERRQIPSVVTRCIEEVELRGMDIEGIYRKTGGSGQVKLIQEGFDKMEDFDISDPGLDITAVTSVLKQYFRKLPTPLLTFDVYDRILESNCKLLITRHGAGLTYHSHRRR